MSDLSPVQATPSSGETSRRARLVAAATDLCEQAPRTRSPAADKALADAMLALMAHAELAIRRSLAERLATADWAPHALVTTLAFDDIEVARPILAASPALVDADLLRVLNEAEVEHRVAVARRPRLSPTVADRAAADPDTVVLAALASNEATELPGSALQRLVETARHAAELRGPLARRPELSSELALQLYAVVGEGLRQSLAKRFQLPADRLAPLMDEAVASAAAGKTSIDRDETERRLVQKLHRSGQLRSGFLVKSLRDGRLGLFEAALAALIDAPRDLVSKAVRSGDPQPLALACAAAGVDRGAFPTLLSLVRRLNGGLPTESTASASRVRAAFEQARDARRRFLASVAP